MSFRGRFPIPDSRRSRLSTAAIIATVLLTLLTPLLLERLKQFLPAIPLPTLLLLIISYLLIFGVLVGFASLLLYAYTWLVLQLARPEEMIPQFAKLAMGLSADTQRSDSQVHSIANRTFARLIRPALHGVAAETQALRRQVAQQSGSPVGRLVSVLATRWSGAGREPPPTVSLTLTDPIHGPIQLDSALNALFFHPIVQRLHEIRQLTFAFPSHPGGTHSRLSHSLGVAHLADKVMRRVFDQNIVYTREGITTLDLTENERNSLVRLAVAGGLLHDIAHTPLGHSLDQLLGTRYLKGASRVDKEYLPGLLTGALRDSLLAADVDPDRLVRLFARDALDLSGWDVFVSTLLDSSLDVDRLDYLVRDAHFTGQQEGLLDLNAFVAAFRPYAHADKIYLAIAPEFISHLEQFVYARDIMYLRTYEKPEKVVSERLAVRAIMECLENAPDVRNRLDAFVILSDFQLLAALSAASGDELERARMLLDRAFGSEALVYEEIMRVPFREYAIEDHLEALLKDWTLRSHTLTEKVAEMERRIATTAGVSRDHVVVTVPETKLSEERSELAIDVLRKDGDGWSTQRLLDPRTDRSPSEIFSRQKYVQRRLIEEATDLEQLKRAVVTEGFSLLTVLRDARAKLRIFLHANELGSAEKVRDAVVSLGVKEEYAAQRTRPQ